MLTTLLGQRLESVHVPLSQNALGVTLLMVGVITHYTAVKASGVLAFGVGATTFYLGLFHRVDPIIAHPDFLLCFGLFLFTYAAAERLFNILQHDERVPSRIEDVLRSMFVVLLAAMGMLTLYVWAQRPYLTVYWLLLSVVVIGLGALFRESRYRWTGLLMLLIAIVRAFAVDVRTMPPLYRLLSFAALTVAVMILAWAYSHYRSRMIRKPADPTADAPSTHESATQGS
jgi:hypothetical protein